MNRKLARAVRRSTMHDAPMKLRLGLAAMIVATLGTLGAGAFAAPAKKKFHLELTAVTPKAEVKPEVAKSAVPRVEAQVKKAFETDPQLVATGQIGL